MEIKIDNTADDLVNFLGLVDKEIKRNAINAGARKAAKPVISEARSILDQVAKTDSKEYSKLGYVKRSIIAETPSKRYGTGVNIKVKGADLRVGDRFWKVLGYAILLGEGSYKSGNRLTRKTKQNRGFFRGFGNFIETAWQRKGSESEAIFISVVNNEVEAALDRSNKRISKKING